MEHEALVLSRQLAPSPRYQASMETPDDASEGDAQDPEFMPLPRGMGIQPQPPHYVLVVIGVRYHTGSHESANHTQSNMRPQIKAP